MAEFSGTYLIENINQGVVVCRAEDLGNESAAFRKELCRQPTGVQRQFRLGERILCPRSSDVWGTVAQHQINGTAIHFLRQRGVALLSCDILCHGDYVANRTDRHEVDADDLASRRHVLGGHLQPVRTQRRGSAGWHPEQQEERWRGRSVVPTARRGAEVDASARLREKVVLFVQLHQLEGRTTAVALHTPCQSPGEYALLLLGLLRLVGLRVGAHLLLGQVVKLIQAAAIGHEHTPHTYAQTHTLAASEPGWWELRATQRSGVAASGARRVREAAACGRLAPSFGPLLVLAAHVNPRHRNLVPLLTGVQLLLAQHAAKRPRYTCTWMGAHGSFGECRPPSP